MLVKIMSALFVLTLLVTACAAPAAPAPAAPAATAAPAAAAPTTAPAAPAATSAAAAVTLTYLVDDSQNSQDTAKALADAYMALHPERDDQRREPAGRHRGRQHRQDAPGHR